MATVALVGPEVEENLSLRYLAAALGEQGCSSEIVPFNAPLDLAAVLEHVLTARPLVVGLSLSFQWRAKDVLALAMGLRDRGYRGHITGGGHFAAFAWAELLRDFPELDSICLHEAEETLPALLKAVAEGCSFTEIPGLASRGPDGPTLHCPPGRVPDLARVRWPDRRAEPTHLSVDARWGADDRVDVRLRVDRIGGGSGELSFQGDPIVRRGGTLLQKERTETSLTFACRAGAASDRLDVDVPMACDTQSLRPLLGLDITGARDSGTQVPFQIIVTP